MITQPFLYHPPLLPGESLPSLIARLAKNNDYEPRGLLSSIIRESGKFKRSTRLGCPSLASHFRWIGTLTNKTPYELYKATAHRFTSVLTPPENEIEYFELAESLSLPLLSRGVALKQVRPEYACQFCPQCLKAAAYHRLIWLPIASTACLEHKSILVDSCPKCGTRVKIQDIIETSCSRCKTNFTEAQTVSVKDDDFGLFTQNVIQSWLLKGISPASTTYLLAQQMPRCLFRVIDGLRSSIMPINQDWALMHHVSNQQYSLMLQTAYKQILTTYQSYCLYATACKGIIDWPSGFHLFLAEYQKRDKKSNYNNGKAYNGLSNELGNLYNRWINKYWKLSALHFVQEAFNQYLVDNQTSFVSATRLTRYRHTQELGDILHYISLNEAAKLLDTSNSKLKLMIKSGRLTTYSEKGRSSIILLKREDVLGLHDKWCQALTLEEVMDWLGLSNVVVIQLVQIGLLVAQQSSLNGFHWMFSREDVIECMERVTGRAHNYSIVENSDKENMLTLAKATRLFKKKLGSGTTALTLQQVALGRLPAYFVQDSKPQLGTLLFTRIDIAAYIETVKAEKGWIEQNEVASILGIYKRSVIDWVKAGWISPVVKVGAQTYYFNRKAVENLKSNLVLSEEASTILGVKKWVVYDLVQQGRLKALRGPAVDGSAYYVFSRDSLLEWKDTRASFKEASRLLHISKQKLVFWVTQGKAPLPEQKNLKPWFFSLQDLYKYKESEQERLLPTSLAQIRFES
jgi:TniQ/Helix-turn-helix domain